MYRSALIALGSLTLVVFAGCDFGKRLDGECRNLNSCTPNGEAGAGGQAGSANGGAGGQSGGGSAPCDGACSGATPVCREDANSCVECTTNAHCSGAEPVCEPATNTCVQCRADNDCATREGTPYCAGETATCVACVENAQCGDATASRCEDGACAACETNEDCAHVEGKGVCDAGECVQCTADAAAACGSNPCNPVTKLCSAFGTDRRPCDSCDTDANCANPEHYCVPMFYQGTERPGGYCLKTNAEGCEQPYSVRATERVTLSGVTGAAFCGINETLTTCEAVRGLADNQTCPLGTDAECPQGALCRRVGDLTNRCTYACTGAVECLASPTPGSTCGSGTPPTEPTYCGG